MLDPKEEKRFEELRGMCRELKVPAPPEIMIGLQVHDKNGILIFDDVQRGHSWLRNFYSLIPYKLFGLATDVSFGVGYISAKRDDASISWGNLGNADNYGYPLPPGIAGNTTYGITIGTSDTAFSADHYTLQALIAHGNGAGQMSYTAGATLTKAYTAGTKTWKFTRLRIFNNNSGGSITVKEVGIQWYDGGQGKYIIWERSVLAPTVVVANGAQLTVTYEISMDFSAID
jgi:hypothetical protein